MLRRARRLLSTAAGTHPPLLRIPLSANRVAEISPLWLRLRDPARFTANGQRLFEISDVVERQDSYTVQRSETTSEGVEVEWADDSASFFSHDWLGAQLPLSAIVTEDESEELPPRRQLWNSSFEPPRLQYDGRAGQRMGIEQIAKLGAALERYGLVVLEGVPTEEGAVERVGNEIGFVRQTNYGTLFDVIDLGDKGNSLAQTNCRITQHTDNPYRDPFPGVQMLHCLANATAGGATTFSDGFSTAADLRREDPAAFALLAKHRHPFTYRDPSQSVLLHAEVPVIQLDPSNEQVVERISFNNRSAGCLALPPAELVAYYAAWATFDRLANDDAGLVRVHMRPGDLAIFSNSRVMHGREEYTAGAGRHLQGCYVDHDALRSRLDWALSEQGADLATLAG
jgi:gamma-butyrobetaine dioxygenase